jgi:uncharacterized membrane protein YphA (DoxX/SURF4 family)
MKLWHNKNADARTVGSLVALLLVIAIGILVFWSISGSIVTGTTSGETVHADVNSTAGTIFTLAPIIAIVAVAGLILGVVSRFGAGGGGL